MVRLLIRGLFFFRLPCLLLPAQTEPQTVTFPRTCAWVAPWTATVPGTCIPRKKWWTSATTTPCCAAAKSSSIVPRPAPASTPHRTTPNPARLLPYRPKTSAISPPATIFAVPRPRVETCRPSAPVVGPCWWKFPRQPPLRKRPNLPKEPDTHSYANWRRKWRSCVSCVGKASGIWTGKKMACRKMVRGGRGGGMSALFSITFYRFRLELQWKIISGRPWERPICFWRKSARSLPSFAGRTLWVPACLSFFFIGLGLSLWNFSVRKSRSVNFCCSGFFF